MFLNCGLSPFDNKEVKPVNRKGNQFWIFFGRTDAAAEAPILWPPNAKSWLWKTPWCWERLRAEEMSNRRWDGWMSSLTQRKSVSKLGDREGQGSLACCSLRVGHGSVSEQQQQLLRTGDIFCMKNLSKDLLLFVFDFIQERTLKWISCVLSHSVVSDSLRSHRL